nr:hypothetical protein [Limosilactobacillus mucosae]
MTIITTSYEETLSESYRIADCIPQGTFEAIQSLAIVSQQISETLAPVQKQLLQLEKLFDSRHLSDIRISSTLNRIGNEIAIKPVDSFIKLSETVDNFSESKFDIVGNDSSERVRNSRKKGDYNRENPSVSDNVKVFLKSQLDKFQHENSILKAEKPDVEKCFGFFKFLFHSLFVLFVVIGANDQAIAFTFIEAVLNVIDDVLSLNKK